MADFDEQKKRAAEQYSTLTDEELEQLAGEAWSLTDAGKQALQAELDHRAPQIELATTSPPPIPPSNLVTLRKFRDMPEALLAKGALESAGIESVLMDETTIRMDWLWSNALGGIKLCVKPQDADAAAQLLSQETPETLSVEGVGDYAQPRCPKCGSLDISYEDLAKHIAHPSLLLGIPIPLKYAHWECQACGHEWLPASDPTQES